MLCGTDRIPSRKVVPLVPHLVARLFQPNMEPRTTETIKQTLAHLSVEHPHHTIPALVSVLHFSQRSPSYKLCVENVEDIIGHLNDPGTVELVDLYRSFFGALIRFVNTPNLQLGRIRVPEELQHAYPRVLC